MKRVFYVGLAGWVLLEFARIYFIMPMPGSQRMPSIDVAYWVHCWRWPLRGALGALVLSGVPAAWRTPGWRKWLVPASLGAAGVVAYLFNFLMSADRLFLQPTGLVLEPRERNAVAEDRLVVGVEIKGQARAYPLQFIGYHHQVRDTIGGEEVLVSYCTVCRTGRAFLPTVEGRPETFRLVGMDHFNALFEDRSTGSWWRQANGEAVAGPLKGAKLPELPSRQVTLKQWLEMHPGSLIMQGDPAFAEHYTKDYAYERGTSRKPLTGTDTNSWQDKSWVVGLTVNEQSKAYDWNRLVRERIVHDEVGGAPVLLVLCPDDASFFAFIRPEAQTRLELRGDRLVAPDASYALSGQGDKGALTPLNASQEFWHSWRTFHLETERY